VGRGRTTGALLAIVSLIAAALPLSLVVASATPAGAALQNPVRILPLGDSITKGIGHPTVGGYRDRLENELVNHGKSFDFIGEYTDGPASLADKHHEGIGGKKIGEMTAMFNLVKAQNPDIVLLIAGTNDMGDGWETAHTRLQTLINTILGHASVDYVVVGTIPPRIDARPYHTSGCPNEAFLDPRHQSYNNQIKGMASARVKVVDMYPLIKKYNDGNGPGDMADCRHPDQSGYEKMGTAWYNSALAGILTTNPPVTVPTAPRNPSAVAGNGQATVSFDPPSSNGGAAVTEYTVTSTPGNVTKVGSGSPLTVTGLTNGTNYTFTVKAKNSAGYGPPSVASNLVTPTAPPAGGTYLSDLNASAGSGAHQKDKNAVGGPMVLNGVSYTKGIGVNANNTVTYALGGQYKNFITDVGIDDSCTGTNKSNIQIVADGVILFPTSGAHIFTPSSPTLPLNLDVTGRSSLSLTASGAGDGTTCDRIDWANARLTTSGSTATAPGAPTIGPATAGDASATLDWTAPASDGGSPITAYIVYNGTGTTSPVWFGGQTPTNADITGLTNGTPYQFTVRAQNSVGLSNASALSNTVTPQAPAPTAPGAPTIGNATAGNASATVRWTAPASNGGSAITKYQIVSIPETTTQEPPAGATSFDFTGLQNNTAYTFKVRAVNAIDNGPYSGESNSVTPQAPTAPGAPTIGNATAGNASATVRWTAPASDGGSPITGYDIVSIPATSTQTAAAGATSFNFPGLQNNTAYKFTVVAKNIVGPSNPSAESNSVTPTAPSATEKYLSDLVPTPSGTGRFWNDDARVPGTQVALAGQAYPKGVQVKPAITLTYSLPGGYTRFRSDIGIDDACGDLGSVRFKVFLDGASTPAYDSFTVVGGAVTGAMPKQTIDLDISGKTSMKLELTVVNTSQCHFSDWADAKLVP
jgi:hypothetical protein